MKFGNYKMDTFLGLLALVFIAQTIYQKNIAFLGAVAICLIFGLKKIDKDKD